MSDSYWKAVSINSRNPHIINKKISSFKLIECVSSTTNCFCDVTHPDFKNLLELTQAVVEHGLKLKSFSASEFTWECLDGGNDIEPKAICNLKRLFSKGKDESNLELEVLCFFHNKVTYLPIGNPHFKVWYQVSETDNDLSLLSSCTESREHNWLSTVFLPKLKKWYHSTTVSSGEKSNRHIDSEEYQQLYNNLKLKYGTEMVRIWPECTDPAKFVYEDVAIAAYLLLIWKSERDKHGSEKLQSFIDIGCGNGLLVYILSSEGHPGRGVDIRARKIWSLYPPHVKLEVGVIHPNSKDLQADWLIGNHSDELTPWMPVFAAKFNSNYFVLPCCPFNFFEKFQIPKGSTEASKYQSYLDFVEKIGNVSGFKVRKDRLKIPSTKRICFIGTDRETDKSMEDIENFIKSQIPGGKSLENFDFSSYFSARDPEEPVKNCTKIDPSIKTRVVDSVVNQLLQDSVNFITISGSEKKWNAGRTLAISEFIKLISKEDLLEMKNECGGLQTLLRNHSHIFVVFQGTVRLRSPAEMSVHEYRESKANKKRKLDNIQKRKECWFFLNHPDGCPCSDEECRFLHPKAAEV